jgi:hypothetical protein
MVGFTGSIQGTAAVAYHLPAHRRRSPLEPSGDLTNRRTRMYGPPPCRKRKVRVTGWSAQMYAAFVGAVALGQDGMRCALVPISNAALKGFFRLRVFRAPGSTVVPSHCSPADLAGKYKFVVVAGLGLWKSHTRFPSQALARRHLQARGAEPLPASKGGR